MGLNLHYFPWYAPYDSNTETAHGFNLFPSYFSHIIRNIELITFFTITWPKKNNWSKWHSDILLRGPHIPAVLFSAGVILVVYFKPLTLHFQASVSPSLEMMIHRNSVNTVLYVSSPPSSLMLHLGDFHTQKYYICIYIPNWPTVQ